MIHNISRFIAALALLATAQTARAWLTDFVAVSQQGTATARFAYSDHFYRVDWSGINTSQTTTVKLDFITSGRLVAQRNGNTSSDISLVVSASDLNYWKASHITGLTPGQTSDGYTINGDLATGASNKTNGGKKVCTVTCLSANAPTWNWSADYTTCTATFTCTDDASLTATVEATVTAAGGSITASATFNGTAYSDTKTDPWGRSDGRDGSEAKPYAIGSPEALALLSAYVNAGNNASGLHFEQTQDIDMSSAGNFTPIGYDNPFKGIYDGKGHAITGLTVNTTSRNAGLFGYLEGGSIRNVTMVNPSLTCSFSGSSDDKRAGGIVGLIRPGTIMNCNVINPTLSAGYKGAICGTINGGGWCEVRDCYYYTTGSVGAVGWNGLNQTVTGGRIYTLTLASGITTSTAPAFSYGGTDYYAGTITLAAPPTGWTYAYSVNGSAIGGNTFDISADASVTVTRTPIDYTITYNLGGGTNASGNPSTYTIQSPAITLSAPTRTGYTFGGWYANSSLTGDAVTTIGGGQTGDVTLWAKWTPKQYTITYNLSGGTNAEGNPTAYTIESEAITLGAATKTGYQFGGWYRSADLSGDAVTTIATGTTGDVELWAKWTANRYAIAFVGNGKTGGTMYNELFTYDEAKALTACAYTRTGYHFAGWNTESDGSGTAYADGQEVLNLTAEPDATLTLYAQWTANTYSVHFEPVIPVNGTMADMTLTYDQEATALTRNAFSTTTGQWLRWNTQADGSGTNYEDEAVVQNLTAEDGGTVTLYAQWRLQHRYNYNSSIFRCYNVDNSNQVYWAYAGEKVKVEVIDGTSEYTIRVVNGDGEDITLDTGTNTFTMPDEEVWITYTSVKKMAYTTICLDDFDSSDDVAYLYDASQPTVTPTVTVMDGETVLTEGTDYTLAITNNTGSATQMVTATVTVTGMGGYVGTNTREFRITPFNIANCEIKGTLEVYDDGYGALYPLANNVEVWNGETKLTYETDYRLEIVYPESYYETYKLELGNYTARITGTGDWGGSQTFQFKVVELHHTVVFVANGGSGTMASDVATKGQHYTLPACGFTAPDGKKFSHWVASCEPDAEKQPGDYFTAPYIWSESDVQTITVTAYWRDKATFTVTLPEEMEVVSGTLTDGKAIEDEVITFRPRPGFTATDVQANGTALTPDGEGIYTLTVTADVTVTATFRSSTIDLTDASGDFAAINNDVLTGTTSHTVTIANGASITLNNVAITGGIVCEGTAEITLVGENAVGVTSLDGTLIYQTAGIQIGSSGTTLTIKGNGSLNATGGSASAGIGLGRTWDANATGGSVVIEGGTVTASGGNGIGTGTVGNSMTAHMDGIIIKGGTVNARLGKGTINYGSSVTIGAIKIYDTIDKVDASAITESVTYMHVENETETDVTASASTYFTIIEDVDRRIIEKKDDTDYTITILGGIEHGTIACAATTAKFGDKVTITATPDFGYRLSNLVVKDADNNDVATTGNTFQMPKGNVTVSAVFEQGTHGTTEFAWGYFGQDGFVTEATIYDGVTTVNLQQGQSYQILKYDESSYSKFILDNSTYEATIPYSGGTGTFPEDGNGTNFRVDYNSESGFYDITMTDVGNDKWSVSILKTVGVIDNIPDQTYTGSEITPEPLVLAGSLSLTKGTDYEYSYTNNTNVGTATVRATFQGTYASLGYVERTFTILPPPVVVVNVTGNGTVTYNDKSAASGETIGVTAEKGTDVTLTLTPGNGYAVRSVEYGYTKSNETTMNGAKLPINGTTATLTVPNDLKDGTYVNLTVTFVSALVGGADEASAVALTDNTLTDLAGGWYKVDSDITFDHTLSLLNETYLTIAEDKTMTVNTASNRGIYSDYTLFVSGDGALSVTTTAGYGIAVLVGNYVQTGATVTASGYIGIRCTDDFIAFNFDNDFTFSSGQLTATGSGGDGIWANNTITLGWTNPADRITASSYKASGTVKVADGKALTDGSGNIYTGTLTDDEILAIAGKTLQPALLLADAADNTAAITAHAGQTLAVALSGRTLYKDGSWNTLCLPFAVSTASGTLSGDDVKAMTLDTKTSNLTDGTLTLNFDAATTIPAGTPFIIKWDESGTDITNPVFEGVTVSKATNDATVDGVLTFTGTYAPVKIADGGDNTKLYLGSGNKLYYPNAAMTIGCQRAYFQLLGDLTAGKPAGGNEHGNDQNDPVRAFVLNFGDDEANGILSVSAESSREALPAAWYTLDGRRLDGQPTAKGLYIHGGKKVIVK